LSYHYHRPEPPYNNTLQELWQVDHITGFSKEYIIPKGIVEIIFNFSEGEPIAVQQNNKEYRLPHCFINGFNKTPIQLQLPQKQVFFGAIFQPLGIKKLFGSPAAEFSDTSTDVTLINNGFHSLWHQLAEQNDFGSRVAILQHWVMKNWVEWQPQERLINDYLYAQNRHHESVGQLAGSLCYSPRHLGRKILEATGMNTEELILYKKYLHAVELMHHTDLQLTAIAYQCHFSDQAHFIKSFKSFTGMTPGAYRRNKSTVKGHLYENVR